MLRVFCLFVLSVTMLGACGGEVANRWVLRVDRALDASSRARLSEPIDEASYTPQPPADRYEIVVRGDAVEVAPLDGKLGKMTGAREASTTGETRFRLSEGTFAGGVLVVRGDRGEITIYGSGVPIVLSERGALISR
ncbi:MAG: hypothetical protein KF819_30960 [Labilithrix sp.]|nr:hypothetical protein [Labilithrix sp.]